MRINPVFFTKNTLVCIEMRFFKFPWRVAIIKELSYNIPNFMPKNKCIFGDF